MKKGLFYIRPNLKGEPAKQKDKRYAFIVGGLKVDTLFLHALRRGVDRVVGLARRRKPRGVGRAAGWRGPF